jgi:predicted nucleic acid-binding protein
VTPTPIARGVIDTPILVLYREGDAGAALFIQTLRAVVKPDVSQWSMLYLYVWAQSPSDQTAVRMTRSLSHVHEITAPISKRAAALMDQLPSPSPLTAGDAIVAATALELKIPLYTLDPARFAAVPKLTTTRPY